MLQVYDKNMKAIGILENATEAPTNRRANELWTASFSMPIDDPKNELCSHFYFVEFIGVSGRNYGLYRIMPKETKKLRNIIVYKCEHVLATLLDDVMDGYFQWSNYTTRDVLQGILDLQETKHWVLGQVDFTRWFHYKFENENGLLAPIFSIPKPFDEPYLFTFDTTVYPWVLNLVRPSDDIVAEIRWGKDMIDFNEVVDPTDIVNYIIPKGAGEGVNQYTIESVNGGKKYLKDDTSIAKWGLHKRIWIDRRFENVESLKANGQSILNQQKDPKISFDCPSTDLSLLPEYAGEKKVLYGVTRIAVDETEYEARIVGESIADILGREHDVKYEINNKLDDIATTQADMDRKIQVNEAYSQGATNISNYSYNDNADPDNPAEIEIYLPAELVKINKLILSFKTTEFRSYERAIESGGAISKSTAGGGGTTKTTSSGGGVSKSTASGGGNTKTSSGGGNHTHRMWNAIGYGEPAEPNSFTLFATGDGTFYVPGVSPAGNSYTTAGASGNHTHSVDIPAHTHDFEVPHHDHSITLGPHTHDFEIPNHTHGIEFGIYKLDRVPNTVTIKVDGNIVPHTQINGDDIDLIPYLEKDSSEKVTRGWHTVTIAPNDLGRINAQIYTQFFIQSRGGGSY